MRRLNWRSVGVILGLTVAAASHGTTVVAQSRQADFVPSLAGTWRAEEYKVNASSDLDVRVWGPNAFRVRNVELALEPDGDGFVKVFTSVVDAAGKVRPYSASVVEARLAIKPPDSRTGQWFEPTVTVLDATQRFLDGSGDSLPVDGLRVKIHVPEVNSPRLEFRYDTLRGAGSFGETLWRPGRSASAAARRF